MLWCWPSAYANAARLDDDECAKESRPKNCDCLNDGRYLCTRSRARESDKYYSGRWVALGIDQLSEVAVLGDEYSLFRDTAGEDSCIGRARSDLSD